MQIGSSKVVRPLISPPSDRDRIPLAALCMVGGVLLFIAVDACVKRATAEVASNQAVLCRSVVSGAIVFAIMRAQSIPVASQRLGPLVLRGLAGCAALLLHFWAIAHMPLADVRALHQTSPIMVAFLSILVLRERPRLLHYLLAATCLAGAVMVVRPTRGILSLVSLAPLASALFSALAYVTIRSLTRTEPTMRIVLWFTMASTVVSLPLSWLGWKWPSLEAWLMLVGAGVLSVGGQVLMTSAYRYAQAHVASAFSYASVLFAYLAGLLLWGERPDAIGMVGMVLIMAGGVAVALRLAPASNARGISSKGAPSDDASAPAQDGS